MHFKQIIQRKFQKCLCHSTDLIIILQPFQKSKKTEISNSLPFILAYKLSRVYAEPNTGLVKLD